MKLLTIAIPTFNRFNELSRLIDAIARERSNITNFDEYCDILVIDNASAWYQCDKSLWCKSEWDFVKFTSHSENIGGDANVRACFKAAKSTYIWIIGDDDLPIYGFINYLISILNKKSTDLIYLTNTWHDSTCINLQYQNQNQSNWSIKNISSTELALIAGVGITFISSIVTNKTLLMKNSIDPDIYADSYLPQLGWVLPFFHKSNAIYIVNDVAVLATSGGSGGYSVLKIFTNNYLNIISHGINSKSPATAEIFKNELILNYLPGLINQLRKSKLGDFNLLERLPKSINLNNNFIYKVLLFADCNLGSKSFSIYVILSKCIYRIYQYFKLIPYRKILF
jgi:abequosyltransferase